MNTNEPTTTQLLTEQQAAAELGVSHDTLYRLRKARKIPFIKFGRTVRYHVPTVLAAKTVGRRP